MVQVKIGGGNMEGSSVGDKRNEFPKASSSNSSAWEFPNKFSDNEYGILAGTKLWEGEERALVCAVKVKSRGKKMNPISCDMEQMS